MSTPNDRINRQSAGRNGGVCEEIKTVSSQAWLRTGDVMSKRVHSVDAGMSMSEAARIMAEAHISCVVVRDGGKCAGMLTETDFLQKSAAGQFDFDSMTAGSAMSAPLKSISPDVSIVEACRVMDEQKIKRLAVMEDGHLSGIVTQTDMLKSLSLYGTWKGLEDIMSKDVAVVHRSDQVSRAADVMDLRGISCVVVEEDKKPVGIVSKRDLLTRVIAKGLNPASVVVSDIMSSPVVTAAPDNSILSTGKMMQKESIRRVVVTDNDQLVGIVAQIDIIRAIQEKLQHGDLHAHESRETARNGLCLMNAAGEITYVNPSLLRLLGIKQRKTLLGTVLLPKECWERAEDREAILDAIRNAEGAAPRTVTLIHSDKTSFSAVCLPSITFDAEGRPVGAQASFYEINGSEELNRLRQNAQHLSEKHRLLEERVQNLEKAQRATAEDVAGIEALMQRIEDLESRLEDKE